MMAMSGEVRDNRGQNRFELEGDGGPVAIIAYERQGGTIVLIHTEVPEELSGQGVGSRLVGGALDMIRSEGLRVDAQCSFVAAFIERHPAYRDLLV
jgi:predicted GNAT family acetyltransferase